MNSIVSVAIDGPAGAGKSETGKKVAFAIGGIFLDTGAMYRALALYVTRLGGSVKDEAFCTRAAREVPMTVRFVDKQPHIFLESEDVTGLLRTPEMDAGSSAVSSMPAVRREMVARQQKIAEGVSVVMDGRDIASVVLPNATLKLYLTASVECRARRRYEQKKGVVPYEEVLRDLIARDEADSSREASPLKQAEDAVLLDNTDLTEDETVAVIVKMLREKAQNA